MLTRTPTIALGTLLRVGASRYVVLHFDGNDAVTCEIIDHPNNRHRADVRLTWPETLFIGAATECVIRCAPKSLRGAWKMEREGTLPVAVLDRVTRAARREAAVREWEDAEFGRA